jgi:hypothetical protein
MQVSARWAVEVAHRMERYRANSPMATEQWRWRRRRLYPMGDGKGKDVPRRGWRAEPVASHPPLICKRRKRDAEGSEVVGRLNMCATQGCQLPSVHHHVDSGSGGGGAEKRTPHTHTRDTPFSIDQTRGRRPESRVGVVVVVSTCTEGHRRGRWGWTVGCLQRPDKAAICIDCDQQTCASTVKTAATTTKTTTPANPHSIIALLLPWT